MPDHYTQPTSCHPASPMLRWTTLLARWPQSIAVALLLGMFVMTLRAAVHELGGRGVWLAVGSWVYMGIPAALDRSARAYGDLPRRADKWT